MADIALYNSAIDAKIYAKENPTTQGNLLLELAEMAHRFMALGTNLGTAHFTTELHASLLLDVIFHSKEPRKMNAQKDCLIDFQASLERLAESYEILDETFSACFAYAQLLQYGKVDEIQQLEDSLGSYGSPQILQNYNKVKALVQKFAGFPLVIFLDAAQIPIDDEQAWYSGGQRLDFFLTMAEQGLERGVQLESLRDYYLDKGMKIGYSVDDQLSLLDVDTMPEFVAGSHLPINAFVDEHIHEELRQTYKTVLAVWQKDRELWVKHFTSLFGRPISVDQTDLNSLRPVSPTCVAYPENGKWRMQFRKSPEDQMEAWPKYVASTIFRNALFTGEKECPLAIFRNSDGRSLCTPLNDERCFLRAMRILLHPLVSTSLRMRRNGITDFRTIRTRS